MRQPRAVRDLERLKWMGVLVPIALIWTFEVGRYAFVDGTLPARDEHVISALMMAGGIVLFGMVMAVLLERTQREILGQNRDLGALKTVGSAVRADRSVALMARVALERMIEQTGAVGGVVNVAGPDGKPLLTIRPDPCPSGLEWLGSLLREPFADGDGPTYIERSDLDTLILELRFDSGPESDDRLRLAFHPAVRPGLSDSVLEDLAREIGMSLRIERLVGDLHRREHERRVLYELALQLTERSETRDILDTIAGHARELLAAERAIVCLADPTQPNPGHGRKTDRLAVADDGEVCFIVHEGNGAQHARNPLCPFFAGQPDVAWLARPLRGPGEVLGELCVTRPAERPFSDSERTLLGALADMAAIAVRTARLHETEQQMTILSERDRIARELHDSLAQVLGQIHLQLRALEARQDGSAIATDLDELANVADEAYRDVRETILGLRETIPTDGGLEAALRAYLGKFSRQTGISAELECDAVARRDLAPRAEVQLLRVVQEALTNVRKHAGATRVHIQLRIADGAPLLTVSDDGSGFDPASVGPSLTGGFGLRSMRERVEQIGGTLDVETTPGAGTRIVARLRPEGPHVAPAAAPTAPGR